jgi:hypothetical protein
MKTTPFQRPQRGGSPVAFGCAVAAVWLLGFASLKAAPTVAWVAGGPSATNSNYYGYTDGNTAEYSQFHTPIGLAVDSTGNYLYVADRDNNAIRELDLGGNETITFTTNSISQPVGVAVDSSNNVFVLNYGKGTNGTVLKFDLYGDLLATNATGLTNAGGIALDRIGDVYVTASNRLMEITAAGVVTNVAVITNAGTSLLGIAVQNHGPNAGMIAACDAGNNGIWLINPSTGAATKFAGFNGAGDNISGSPNWQFPYLTGVSAANAKFNHPYGVAEVGDGGLVISDYGNNRVKVLNVAGTVTNLYGVNSNLWVGPYNNGSYLGWVDGTVTYPDLEGDVEARLPSGIAYSSDGTVYVAEDYYHIIRKVTGAGLPLPPPPPAQVPAPEIGSVSFPPPSNLSSFNVISSGSGNYGSAVFNNDVTLAIEPGTNNSQVFFTYGPTGSSIPDPTSGSSPPAYPGDGSYPSQVPDLLGGARYPDMTIEAIGTKNDGSPNSTIVQARIQFIVGNPFIIGNNAAQFTVNDITANATLLYTTDGSDPRTNVNATAIGPISGTNGITLSVPFPSNTNSMLFQIVGVKTNYQSSAVVSQVFSSTNFVANAISFGFASGEASSDFIASPGQTFYAPITLTTLADTKMYSLQFNVTVTNAGPNPGPQITPGAFGFQSMLIKPLTNDIYTPIPPYMFIADASSPPPTNQIISYDGTNFIDLEFADTNINLLGVGWLERYTKTNLYDTLSQTLITYSQAHDDLFPNALHPNGVIVGGYEFQVPGTAIGGQTYQIQIGRPSATDDGIGAPGSDVYIATPTNGSLTAGPINSIKIVTLGLRKYIAGDAYPFRWFNAGDFGDTNLDNADVEQVFQSAAYTLNYPPFDPSSTNSDGDYTNVSDFFDAMDSCGYIGTLDGATGYYTNGYSTNNVNALFNGNDPTINQITFGDGKLDVCDVYVTFRRSLDTSLTWYRRFWTNGVRVAEATNYMVASQITGQSPSKPQPQINWSSTNSPQVNFSVGGTNVFSASPGQTVQVPITAQIIGDYPLRVLMLNLTVEPLDGSPPLTTAVQFAPNPALGAPTSGFTDSDGPGNYAAAWLNSAIGGLTGNTNIGTLTVTIPSSATSMSAYAVHFDEASASPNGLASFPKQTLTGLITLSSRTSSTYNDGIPDSWRLRWFGTVNNLLSVSNACPSGDGVNNWEKYVAGVDPNVPGDFPSLNARTPIPSGATAAIHWPTVNGKQYVILRSNTLFPGNWTPIATNTGTGTDMEFDDNSGGQTQFYRVQILP